MRATLVVAGWGAANAVLAAMLAGFGGSAIPMVIYGASVILVGLIAAWVLLAGRRARARPAKHGPSQPADTATPALIALGAGIAGASLAFGWWLMLVSAVVFLAAILNAAVAIHRRRI